MAGLFEPNQVAKREDLFDIMTIVDEKATPFLSSVRRGSTPQNTLMEWPVDSYAAPALGGVIDGQDVSNYENHAENRDILRTYLQTFRKTAKVSRLSQEVSNVAGVTDELALAIQKKTIELGRNIEATLLSDQEHQADTGSVPYLTRGLSTWVLDTTNIASQTLYQVPAAFRPAAAQIDETAAASITESDIQTMLQSVFDTTGMINDFKFFAGSVLRRAFTDFTRTIAVAGYSSRDLNYDGASNKISNSTVIFEGDFGSVEVIPSSFIGFTAPSGTTPDTSRGFLLDMDKIVLRSHKAPTVERFEDQGGGPRFMIEARCALAVLNPIGLAQFNTNLS